MKTALLIVTYNRPQYLKKTLQSLAKADLSGLNEILIVDDCSTDPETLKLLAECGYYVFKMKPNSGIKKCLEMGYQLLFIGNDLVINLDSDALVRHDFVGRLTESYLSDTILTGFHSTTRNANGSERHEIIKTFDKYCLKRSVGGINMCVDKYAYVTYVLPALNMPGNWDYNACVYSLGAYCLIPSVIEHIGFESSMNHHEQPDTAADFYFHDLKDVTLLCVDGRGLTAEPVAKSTQYLKFAEVVTIHDPSINSKEAYSRFMMKEAYKHIKTSHCLIVQHDGYVLNPMEWDNDWLKYDYIGATWWYQDGMNVGNGGFCLRSKRLMELCEDLEQVHPEDHHICRTYRPYLESKGMKFAPADVADRFSFEGYMQPHKQLTNQFGFHGKRALQSKKTGITYIPNQFKGLGDILFLIPLIRLLIAEGNDVVWPVTKENLTIQKHFPDIKFVDMELMPIDYNRMGMFDTVHGRVIPYRFAIELMGRTLERCMQSKYELYGHDYLSWRTLHWKRDKTHEFKLLPKHSKYILVNRFYGSEAQYQIEPEITSKLPIVEMQNLEGFTLLDWCLTLENASEIHVANSSIMYLLELMQIPVPTHVYKRRLWGEQGFEHTKELWTNPNFIFHE